MSRENIEGSLGRALRWPAKFLFGDDIFISYSRADGATYAAGLADRLAGHNFSCRFDQWGTEPGKEMPASLRGALRRSAMLVLVGSEGAARSTHVASEVADMKRRGRRIVPIAFEGVVLRGGVTNLEGTLVRAGGDTAGSPPEALWAGDVEGLPVSCELDGALKSGEPSDEVVSRIEKTFTFSRKDERLRRATAFVAALLLLLVGASVVAGYVATGRAEEARRKTEEAAAAEKRAGEAEGRAREQEERARVQTARADEAATKASLAEELARDKTKLADEKTKLADEKTLLAAEKTKLAEEQARRADEASRLAAAQELSARKNLARSFYAQAQAEAATEPLRALAWAGGALREAPPGDENLASYAVRALNLAVGAPRAVVNTPTRINEAAVSPDGETVVTVTEAGRFAVWDARTGAPLPHPYADPAADYMFDSVRFREPVFSADSRRYALLIWERADPGAAREPHLRIWEARTGSPVLDVRLEGWGKESLGGSHVSFAAGHIPVSVKFSPDGREAIVFTNTADGMFVWEVATGARRMYETPVEKKESVLGDALPVSPDPGRNWFLQIRRSASVTTAAGREVQTDVLQVRDITTGRVVRELVLLGGERPTSEGVHFADFTRDASKVVVTSGRGQQEDLLRVWDLTSGRASRPAVTSSREHGGQESRYVRDARAISPDGRSVLLMCYRDSEAYGVEVWDITGETPQEKTIHTFIAMFAGVRVTPVNYSIYADDGEHVIDISLDSYDRQEITVWDLRSGRQVNRPLLISGGRLHHVSTRDKTASVAYRDGTLITWDLLREDSLGVVTRRPPLPPNGHLSVLAHAPDWRTVLTVSDNKYGPSKKSLELRDARTWATKWQQADSRIAPYFGAKFSDDGAHFAAVHSRASGDAPNDSILLVHRTSDGEVEPGFRPIPGTWDMSAEFSRDGSEIVTQRRNSGTGLAVKRWSAKTGEPLPGPAGELPYRDGRFLGFTRFGEFYMMTTGQSNQNYTELTLRRVDAGMTHVVTLRFADHGTAALAAALFRAAKEIRTTGAEGVVTTLDSGVEVSAAATPAGAVVTNERTKRRLVPPLDTGADLSKLVLNSDGRLLAATFGMREKWLARVWDAATGLPLSERIWHEGAVTSFGFSRDGQKFMTTAENGELRDWNYGDFAGGTPPWAALLGEALGGVRVAGGVDVQRLPAEEYARARREFEAVLRQAAASGDEAARLLLTALSR